jgi:hypothetical protein
MLMATSFPGSLLAASGQIASMPLTSGPEKGKIDSSFGRASYCFRRR